MKEHNLFHELCMTYLDEEESGGNVVQGVAYQTAVGAILNKMVDGTTLNRVLTAMRAQRSKE